jgi:ribosomal protein S18 acetylase RimI-like enzyme
MRIEKVPITEQDEPFLYALFASTRESELALTPWTDERKAAFLKDQFGAQQRHYLSRYPAGSFQILTVDGRPAGRLYRAELEDEIRIVDLTLAPEFRGRKIGTGLVGEIVAEAGAKNKKVRIYLENFNPAARLFERLGFRPESGADFYILWSRAPESIA